MRIVKAIDQNRLKLVEDLYMRAFPKEERKPFEMIVQKQAERTMDILVLEEENVFAGLAIMAYSNDIVSLDYLAISDEMRGQGMDSKALKALTKIYSGKHMVLEIEPTVDAVKEPVSGITWNLIRTAFLKSLPVMAGYIVLGIGFGILLKEAGYGLFWSFLMSFAIYAGSMQYVAVSLLTSGASMISAALTTLMVNARHLFYGVSMIDKYKEAGKLKPYLIFALTDETYSLLCGDDYPEGENRHWYSFFVSLFDQCYWVLGSVIGSILGSVITFNTAGIDFAMTALFVTVFVEQWLTAKTHLPALAGLMCSITCLTVFGADNFLIPTMIAITIVLALLRKEMEGGAERDN